MELSRQRLAQVRKLKREALVASWRVMLHGATTRGERRRLERKIAKHDKGELWP